MPIITLTTDFGLADYYVAAMKGVLLTLAPDARIVDVTHEIRPQDVVQAAFVFRQAFPCFPPGTIHVVVVDPGVGTARRLLAARYAGQIVLAPDNGVLSLVHHDFPVEALREIVNARWFVPDPAATFAGRDILAPVAGHLAAGRAFDEVGPPTDRLEVLNLASPATAADGSLRGVVIHVDRFGNLVTNIRRDELLHVAPGAHVVVGSRDVGEVRRTYADVPAGEFVAMICSADLLEVSINQGNAAAALGAAPGDAVTLRPSTRV